MTTDTTAQDAAAGRRGPADHAIRQQIMDAADAHFARFGYGKTTVADLAKAIGFSKAYIYKFFESKQAIGEAICTSAWTRSCRRLGERRRGGGRRPRSSKAFQA
jgi:AcrR family transcriptional regulator